MEVPLMMLNVFVFRLDGKGPTSTDHAVEYSLQVRTFGFTMFLFYLAGPLDENRANAGAGRAPNTVPPKVIFAVGVEFVAKCFLI